MVVVVEGDWSNRGCDFSRFDRSGKDPVSDFITSLSPRHTVYVGTYIDGQSRSWIGDRVIEEGGERVTVTNLALEQGLSYFVACGATGCFTSVGNDGNGMKEIRRTLMIEGEVVHKEEFSRRNQ